MDQIVNGLRDILQYVIGLASLVAVGFILYGGFKYMSSRDDPRAVAGARTTLINATVGLILSVMAFPLTNWVLDRVAPEAAGVSDQVLETVVVESVQHSDPEEWNSGTDPTDTRTLQVIFSSQVCVEGQGGNLKLRTDRGNMDLLIGDAAPAIEVASNGSCAADIGKHTKRIPFRIEDVPDDALGEITVSALIKGGSVDIVSPSGAPVNDALTTSYKCEWGDHTASGKKGAGASCP